MSDNDLVQFSHGVCRLLPAVMRQFLKRHRKWLAAANISFAQAIILDILKEKESMRMSELAKDLSVSMAGATGLVDKLVREGLVARESLPDDRRVVKVSVTPKGKGVIVRINEARRRMIMEAFGNLSVSDRDKYLEILTKIHSHLKAGEK